MPHITEMKQLIQELNQASAMYYNLGTSFLTDAEFDLKLKQLETMERVSGICLSNSPTQRVGAEVLEKVGKIKLALSAPPMLSLAKVHTQEEIDTFIKDKEVQQFIYDCVNNPNLTKKENMAIQQRYFKIFYNLISNFFIQVHFLTLLLIEEIPLLL